ncbi:hypothetical protein MMC07_003672 [Pseudocyphellaria aurata]|nr:hypothetical protein [Pseudocyphellaria aurata]
MSRLEHQWTTEGGERFDLAILILASINVTAAVLMIGNITYEAWSKKEWDFYPKTGCGYLNFFPTLHPAEVFPVIFAAIVVPQGVIIIAISVVESHKLLLPSCNTIAQIVWLVLWIGPYTMLVFGLETAFRSFQSTGFLSQGRWHIFTRIIGVLLLTIVTAIPSLTLPARGECFASFIWWTAHLAKPGIAICLTLMFAYITCASVITFQLITTAKIHSDHRIQASRIVCYLLVSTLLLSLIVPYYIQVIMSEIALTASKMAEVALNLTGLVPGLLYLLLRSNANWTMIQPIGTSWWSRKQSLRLSTSANMDVYIHMASPVSLQWESSPKLMHDPEKAIMESPSQMQASEVQAKYPDHPIQPRIAKTEVDLPPKAMLTRSDTQNRVNYSVFPNQNTNMARESVSTAFSQDEEEDLELPRPLFSRPHKRELSGQSNATSATVQIGLRLSVPDHVLSPIEQSPVGNAPDLGLGSSPTSSPTSIRGMMSDRSNGSKKPCRDIAILPIQPNEARTPSQILSPRSKLLSPSWIFRRGDTIDSSHRIGERNVMKNLPPVPAFETRPPHHLQGSLESTKLGWRSENARQAWI